MKIFLASDHAGFEMKNHLVEFLNGHGYTAIDKGAFSLDENDDYPDYVNLVAEEILKDPNGAKGIILGGSGQGEAIAVNRFKGIRAIVYYGGNEKIIELGREHNNSNILSLGARFITNEEAEKAVKLWLEKEFSKEERHIRRLTKIDGQS